MRTISPTSCPKRMGFTLIELICVITIFLIIGIAVLPTLNGMFRDTRTQAAADLTRSRASLARAYAIEQGRNYVLEVSPDNRQIRVAPDAFDLAGQSAVEDGNPPHTQTDTLPDTVTVTVEANGSPQVSSEDGWTRIVTFQPDGTFREPLVYVQVQEPDSLATYIEFRGLTGTTNIVPSTKKQGMK